MMSNETKWTPGEWLLTESETMVYALNNEQHPVNRFSAQLGPGWSDEVHRIDGEELRANAHLIAAAPELYEALDMLMNVSGPGDAEQLLAEERENIIALLAKARGEL